MTFQIPNTAKDFSGLGFKEILPVELNDFDMDRMMTHLLEMFIRHGRTLRSKTDPKAYDAYLAALVNSAEISGLSTEETKETLDGWLRSSVLRMGRSGLQRQHTQMDHLRPITAAIYRSGLPKARGRNRQADTLAYQMMLAELKRRGHQSPQRVIRELTIRSLGAGIDFGVQTDTYPVYDGESDIDVTALLTVLFLAGFPEPGALSPPTSEPDVALPGAVAPIGKDMLNCLALYGTSLPAAEITSHIAALLSLRLFQLPLRLAHAFRELMESQTLLGDWTDHSNPNPLELYCDFTRTQGSLSDTLAKQCVQRDLDRMRDFFGDRLFLRTVYNLDPLLHTERTTVLSLHKGARLLHLVQRLETKEVSRALQVRLNQLETEFRNHPELANGVKLIENLQTSGATTNEILTQVLVEGLRKRGLENQVKWFWSSGGIAKPYGLLRGTLKARTTWRYQPSDQLLLSLLL